MELGQELEKLNELKSVDTEKFETQYLLIKEKFTSPEEVERIDGYVNNMLVESAGKIDAFIEESVKMQLEKVSRIISLSYIARRYFNKTQSWLYQRINGCYVNGKPARFTQEEISTLNYALQDISREIGSTVIKI
jgi:hypothetical protein